jgi:hypothetical protein
VGVIGQQKIMLDTRCLILDTQRATEVRFSAYWREFAVKRRFSSQKWALKKDGKKYLKKV